MIDIGVALPAMCAGFDRSVLVDWCQTIDRSPARSLIVGERICFGNPELWTLAGAAALLTERVRIGVSASILTAHPAALVAKQAATVDHLSGGRLDLGVGTGVRPDDLSALAADRLAPSDLATGVASLREYWAGDTDASGVAVGPRPVQAGGPPVLAAVRGDRSITTASGWADGVTGISLDGDETDLERVARTTRRSWAERNRPSPRLGTAIICCAEPSDSREILRDFLRRYLNVFDRTLIETTVRRNRFYTLDAIAEYVGAAERCGYDQIDLIPASLDPGFVAAVSALVR